MPKVNVLTISIATIVPFIAQNGVGWIHIWIKSNLLSSLLQYIRFSNTNLIWTPTYVRMPIVQAGRMQDNAISVLVVLPDYG